ncbi:MAG: hypothetical protein GY711_02125 [bacterium]|nr:hypothetical protein [bacterium]
MNPVFERNVEELLRRAWKPVRPSPEFEERLLARCLGRLDAAIDGSRAARTVRGPRVAVARGPALIAASVLAMVGAVVLSRFVLGPGGDEARTVSVADLHALGRVAWRGAADDAWRSTEGEPLDLAGARLEVATPAQTGALVRLDPGRSAALEPSSWAIFGPESIQLTCGAVRAEVGSRTRVATPAGDLWVSDHAALAILRASEVDGDLIEVVPTLAIVRVDGAGIALGSEELASDTVHFLQSGRILGRIADVEEPGRETIAVEDSGEPSTPALDPGIELRGRVAFVPAEGAVNEVVVWVLPHFELPKVATPEVFVCELTDGAFVVRPHARGECRIFVEAQGRAIWESKIELESDTATVEVELACGGTVRGFVVDAETGAPLAGALVISERDMPHAVIDVDGELLDEFARRPRAVASTLGGGAFTLTDLSAGYHVLRIGHPDYAPTWATRIEVVPGAAVELEPIELGHGGGARGRVERLDGSGWPDVGVILSRIEMTRESALMTYGEALTDADGSFAIDNLPPGFYVALNLGEQPNEDPEWSRVVQVFIKEGETTQVDFLAPAGRCQVTGVVRDAQGQPVRDCKIAMAPMGEEGWQLWTVVPSDAQGRFEFGDVAPGSYGLFVNRVFETMTFARHVEVGETGEVVVDLVLPPGRVSGIVRGRDGEPAGATMLVLQKLDADDWDFCGKGETDVRGRYEFHGLRDGRYRLSIVSRHHGSGAFNSDSFTVGDDAIEQDFELPSGAPLRVRVTDPNGAPVLRARVRIYDGQGRELFYQIEPFTDVRGELTVVAIREGSWRIRVTHPERGSAQSDVDVVAPDENVVDLVLR